MSKIFEKKYTYNGLGFPVEIQNVEMVMFNGELHPKIDVRKVADSVIKLLISQKTRLTGNQIKFIRTYFAMSLREFAKVVNESHMAVKKWENFENEQTNMDCNIEIMLRLHIYTQVVIIKDKKDKNKFYDQFLALKKTFLHWRQKNTASKDKEMLHLSA